MGRLDNYGVRHTVEHHRRVGKGNEERVSLISVLRSGIIKKDGEFSAVGA